MRKLSRREFLVIGGGVAVTATVAACGGQPTAAPAAPAAAAPAAKVEPTKAPASTAAPAAKAEPTKGAAPAAGKYKEAPMLADLVKAGKLPPADQRLPANPLVVKPHEKIGKYGGTYHIGLRGSGDAAGLVRMIEYNNLMRWDPEFKNVIPDMAESVKASADGTIFTIKLREGVKWSDGKPFGADDIIFWYEDILLNKDLTAAMDPMFSSGDKWVTVKKVDDYTVTFTYPAPYGMFFMNLAHPNGNVMIQRPAHYLKQFHKKHTPDVDKKATDAGLKTWVDYWNLHGGGGVYSPGFYQELGLPRLSAWVVKTPYNANATQFEWERNPYFWKVDPEGNQLPYIDKVQCDVGGDVQALVLKAMKGEIDFQDRHIATLANKPVFADNAAKGGYHFVDMIPANHCHFCLAFNLTHKDANLRKIFNNRDFRIAMSHAMDRKEIADTVYVGQSKPYQPAPREQSPFYDKEMATQYTEFSLDKAAQLLDKAGFDKKDGEGFRLGPDGKRIAFTVESSTTYPEWNDALLLIQRTWKKAGIDMQFKVEDRGLLFQRMESNDVEASVWEGAGGLDVIQDPRWYLPDPANFTGSNFAVLWTQWYRKDPRGEEPPAPAKKQLELYDQLKTQPDEKKQAELMKQILQISKEQFWALGSVSAPLGYAIVKNNFHNVPKEYPYSWTYPTPGPLNSETFYIE